MRLYARGAFVGFSCFPSLRGTKQSGSYCSDCHTEPVPQNAGFAMTGRHDRITHRNIVEYLYINQIIFKNFRAIDDF